MLCVISGGPRQVTILNTVTPYQDRIREKLLGVELLLFKYYCHPRSENFEFNLCDCEGEGSSYFISRI